MADLKMFWKSNFQICPVCYGCSIKEEKTVEGCRPNGDAYGFVTFLCKTVGCWSSIFRYDEAADVYYYETAGWSKS